MASVVDLFDLKPHLQLDMIFSYVLRILDITSVLSILEQVDMI